MAPNGRSIYDVAQEMKVVQFLTTVITKQCGGGSLQATEPYMLCCMSRRASENAMPPFRGERRVKEPT
jgi:hypothetical protein